MPVTGELMQCLIEHRALAPLTDGVCDPVDETVRPGHLIEPVLAAGALAEMFGQRGFVCGRERAFDQLAQRIIVRAVCHFGCWPPRLNRRKVLDSDRV